MARHECVIDFFSQKKFSGVFLECLLKESARSSNIYKLRLSPPSFTGPFIDFLASASLFSAVKRHVESACLTHHSVQLLPVDRLMGKVAGA
jgi:hypothetical protein